MTTVSLSKTQARLAHWQQAQGTTRVVASITAFSVLVSVIICYGVFFAMYGSIREVYEVSGLAGLGLPVLAPLLIAPVATIQLAKALGTAASVIEELEETRAELERLALHDPLTDVLNRRGFFTALAQLPAEQLSTLLLATADVDKFKAVNDTYGHAAGDQVLMRVAQVLTDAAGPGAIVARLGGDEFAVCVVRSSSRADHIRGALEAVTVPSVDVVVRCSLGTADHGAGVSIDETLAAADLALYRDKHGGGEPDAPAFRQSFRP